MLNKIIERCRIRRDTPTDLAEYVVYWATARSIRDEPCENIALLWEVARSSDKDLALCILKSLPQVHKANLFSVFRVVAKNAKSDCEEEKVITFLQDVITLAHQKDQQNFFQCCAINMLCESDYFLNNKDPSDVLMSNGFHKNLDTEASDMIVGCGLALNNSWSKEHPPTDNQLYWALRIATKDFMDATAQTELGKKDWVQQVGINGFLKRMEKNWAWLSGFEMGKSTANELGWLFKVFEQQDIPHQYVDHCVEALKGATIRSVVNHKMIDLTPQVTAWVQKSMLKAQLDQQVNIFARKKI